MPMEPDPGVELLFKINGAKGISWIYNIIYDFNCRAYPTIMARIIDVAGLNIENEGLRPLETMGW